MRGCLPSSPLSFSLTKSPKLGFTRTNWSPQIQSHPNFYTPNCSKLSNFAISEITNSRNARSLFLSRRASENPKSDYGIPAELGFKEKGENLFDLETESIESVTRNGIDSSEESNANASLGSENLLESEGGSGEDKRNRKSNESVKEENRVQIEGTDGDGLEKEENLKHIDDKIGLRKGRQVMRRSNILAKQVISIRSALSLGFVSQLWVNTNSWMVMFVEVRRNLLSGDFERFLLDDITQVGDVVLVEDESVIEDEFKIVGLETLVGYQVITPGRRTIGKVRGYSFNINSGAVESLEFDSFGISYIPSSLVSTYALFVEDVLEVVSDAIIVHEAAASRVHRLTKGFLDSRNVATSIDDLDEYSDFERPGRSDKHSRRRNFGNQKFDSRKSKNNDDWDLPMDYF